MILSLFGFLAVFLLVVAFIFVILVIKSKKQQVENGDSGKKPETPEKKTPKTPGRFWKRFFRILSIVILLGIGFFSGKLYMRHFYDSSLSQEILGMDTKIKGHKYYWELWLLAPDKSGSETIKYSRIIEVQSLGPNNFVFSFPYIYKGKKGRSIYIWDKTKDENGIWADDNPPRKGFWHIDPFPFSDGSYRGWANWGNLKQTMWLIRKN
jgi:hypothetical protein